MLQEPCIEDLAFLGIGTPFLGLLNCDLHEERRLANEGAGAVRLPERRLERREAIIGKDGALPRLK
jgi:hypothetical protein